MTTSEVVFVCDAIAEVAERFKEWQTDYKYDSLKNEYVHHKNVNIEKEISENWFVM